MSNPIPLTDPAGVVRAYLCGCCGAVPVPSQYVGRNVPLDEQAETLHERATRCCVCFDCGAPAPRNRPTLSVLYCDGCDAKRQARAAAETAAWLETMTACAPCGGIEGDYDCDCGGSGLVPKGAVS